MGLFDGKNPILKEDGGFEEITLGTGSFSELTATLKNKASAALLCNTGSDNIYYQLSGDPISGTITATELGIILKPEETLWLGNNAELRGFRSRSVSGTPILTVQYFTNAV